jgi:hypothetical protein
MCVPSPPLKLEWFLGSVSSESVCLGRPFHVHCLVQSRCDLRTLSRREFTVPIQALSKCAWLFAAPVPLVFKASNEPSPEFCSKYETPTWIGRDDEKMFPRQLRGILSFFACFRSFSRFSHCYPFYATLNNFQR